MNRPNLLQQIVVGMLIVLFLAGCGAPAATPVSETPAGGPFSGVKASANETPGATPVSETPAETPTPEPPIDTPTPVSMPEIETSMGTLVVSEVMLTDRYPPDCNLEAEFGRQADACFAKPEEGWQFLIVVLEKAEGGVADSLVVPEEVYVKGESRFKGDVIGTGSEGEVIFTILAAAQKDFQLFWPDNPPIELGK